MKTDEIRTRFLRFFEKRGHKIIASDSLIPHNDPTLLFSGAGMNQFKEEFLGLRPAGFRRAATCQKCIRTGDIANVGIKPFHMTFFEMLGNFSFGDYSKAEACQWAWQFMLEDMAQDPERLFITIFEDDDEAFQIWNERIGIPEAKIFRFGEDENFWPENARTQGPNGPCGPCSEIHYDTTGKSCGRPDCRPGCECRRFVEVWNLVFQEFDRTEEGVLKPLPSKNIDTGMGLERMAAVMQKVPTALDIDILLPVVHAAADAVGKTYTVGDGSAEAQRLRRIADHVRAVSFAISDGALPNRFGRGYVVRRLVRRGAIDGRSLGTKEPFLYKLVPVIIKQMGNTYPELVQRRTTIVNVLKGEEERFAELLTQGRGLAEFEEELRTAQGEWRAAGMPAERLFYFYDTHGIPLEYMEEKLAEVGASYDREEFERVLERRRIESRAGSKMAEEAIVFKQQSLTEKMLEQLRHDKVSTEFVGYDQLSTETRVRAIIVGEGNAETANAPDEALVILDRTPFYAQAGGQVSDVGGISGPKGHASVLSTFYDHEFLVHRVRVTEGSISRKEKVTADVDSRHRLETARNHTATHLLQWALRKVLGEHVHQAGSEVSPERLRFDFTHHTALSDDERNQVEHLVNQQVLANVVAKSEIVPIGEARQQGAIALFGEKYGDKVRMLSIGDFSRELCGGTHLELTAQIGLFKIVGEESVAAGVRRITALTGDKAIEHINKQERLLADVCRLLKTHPDTVLARIQNLQEELKSLERRLSEAKSTDVRTRLDEIFSRAEDVAGVKVIAQEVPGADQNVLREACDAAKSRFKSVVVVLGSRAGGRVNLVAAVTPDLVARGISAGNIIKEAATRVGGGGGGRPEMAQAGGKNPDALPDALASVIPVVQTIVGQK